ncbi:DUF3800 domain-containing protein [Gaoshiqia sp. Z1-71]|uniref:DUF3800 domain-containing protein n=1 Tax=Gaoshiqia hydrogeniformans TaxID=3290090 RepID=UPI003BF8B3E5
MKIGYFDESGTGGEPFAVMTGVIVDSQRMHKTKEHWNNLLETLSRIIKRPVLELHTKDFYPGNGIWRGISGVERAEIITAIIEWLNARKHELIISVIDKDKYEEEKRIGKIPNEIDSIWKAMAFHVILGIQKKYQRLEKTKGHTILIFDNEEMEKAAFADLINNPPAWSDSFYGKSRKDSRLNQIVDVPYWANSEQVGLIQVADFICYFIRRYVEIKENRIAAKYDGEDIRLDEWFDLIKKSSVPSSIMYPSRGRCDTAELYYQLAPDCIK